MQCSSYKIDFKTKFIKKDKEGQYLMIKGSITRREFYSYQHNTPNKGAPKYRQQILRDKKRN